MSSVNTAIQLITREQAEKGATAQGSTCSPALARNPWDYDLAEAHLNDALSRSSDDATVAGILVDLSLASRRRGSDDEARRWVREPAVALEQQRPIDLVATEEGSQLVLDYLDKIEHGR